MNSSGLFITFLAAINAAAGVEMLLYRRKKENGMICYPWLFPLVVAVYLLMNISTALEFFYMPRPFNPAISAAGLVCMAIRFILKYCAVRDLGKYWGVHIEIRPHHAVIREGVYKTVRHPGYLSTVFEMLTIPLAANALLTAAWVAGVYALLLHVRIQLEEKALVRHLGPAYSGYQNTSWRLIPYVY